MGRIDAQNFGNNNPNPNLNPNPNPDQNFGNQPQNYNIPHPLEPSSPYHAYSNVDEQINKPSAMPVNQPYPPPSPMNQPYQSQPPPQQTPFQAYPPADPGRAAPQPVQFPPAPTKDNDIFKASDSKPAQFPPPESDYGQQYNQFQQPNMNNNNNHYDGQGNYYPANNIGMQQTSYSQAMPQQATPVASGIPVVPTSFNEGWSSELFDCMDDPQNALITLCFPCVTFGQIAEIIDNGQTSCATSGLIYGLITAFIGVPCIMSCSYRTKLRNKYGLMETPAPDWITHFLCEPCALCQAYRELDKRGLDPSIGWIGNVAKQQQQAAMMAPTYQTMNG